MAVLTRSVSTLSAALAHEVKQQDLLSTSEGNISMLRERMAFDDRWRSARNKPKSGDYPFRTDPERGHFIAEKHPKETDEDIFQPLLLIASSCL